MWRGVFNIEELSNSKKSWIVVLVFLIGAFLRYLYLITPGIDSDQAVIGLMAKHILEGEMPIFYYGQPYLGSLEAFWVAMNFKLFGISTFVLDMSIAELSMLYFIVIYFFSRELFGWQVALMVLAYVIVAPFYLSFHYVLARGAYIELLVLGTLFLWMIYRFFYRGGLNESPLCGAVLIGILAGVIWWLHPMGIYYIGTGLIVILFSGRKFLLTRYMLIFLVMFFVGSFPFWFWHAERHFYTLGFLCSGGKAHYWKSFLNMWTFEVPVLLGFYRWLSTIPQIPVFSWILFMTFLLFVFWSFFRAFTGLIRQDGKTDKDKILVLFLVVVTLVYISSGWGEDRFPRHLIPLFSVFPIFIAAGIHGLGKFSKLVSSVLFVAFIGSNFYSCYPYLFPVGKRISNYNRRVTEQRRLFAFLEENGLDRVYAPNYWVSLRLTFESGEKIIFSSLHSRYPKYTAMVDASMDSAYLLKGGCWYERFDKIIKDAGFPGAKRVVVGDYSIFYHFDLLRDRFIAINRGSWKGFSEAFDGDIKSRWKVVAPVKRGSSFLVDLGKQEKIGMLRFVFPKMYAGDLPFNMDIYLSGDMKEWKRLDKKVAGFYTMVGKHLYYKGCGFADVIFPDRIARYIKVVYLAGSKRHDWSVPEVFLYRRVNDSLTLRILKESRSNILSYAGEERPGVFFGDYFTAPLVGLRLGVTSLCYGNSIQFNLSKGRFYVEYEDYRWRPMSGKEVFVFRRENLPVVEDMLGRWKVRYNLKEAGDYFILKIFSFGFKAKKYKVIKPSMVTTIGEKEFLLKLDRAVSLRYVELPFRIRYVKVSSDGRKWVDASFMPAKLYWIDGLLFTSFGNGEKEYIFLSRDRYRYWKIGTFKKISKSVHIKVKGK